MYFIVSHFYHEPPAREIGQPLPVHLTVNKLYLYLYFIRIKEMLSYEKVGDVNGNQSERDSNSI